MSVNKQIWTLLDSHMVEGQKEISLDKEEHHYAYHVLRLAEGAEVCVTNCNGLVGVGTVCASSKREIVVQLEKMVTHVKKEPCLHVCLASPRPSVLDEIVSTLSEMGVDHLTIFRSERSAGKAPLKLDKLMRVSREAVRISKSAYGTQIDICADLSQLVSTYFSQLQPGNLLLFCDESHVYENKISLPILEALNRSFGEKWISKIFMFVGPEASFSDNERKILSSLPHAAPVSLGCNVLRVGSAALYGAASVLAFKETLTNPSSLPS